MLFLERFDFSIEAFEQRDQPIFAAYDLLSDLFPGCLNPKDLPFDSARSGGVDMDNVSIVCPRVEPGRRSTTRAIAAKLRHACRAGKFPPLVKRLILAACGQTTGLSFGRRRRLDKGGWPRNV